MLVETDSLGGIATGIPLIKKQDDLGPDDILAASVRRRDALRRAIPSSQVRKIGLGGLPIVPNLSLACAVSESSVTKGYDSQLIRQALCRAGQPQLHSSEVQQ